MDKIKLALYGAGMVGVSVCEAIKTLYENCEITAFLVTEKEGNPSTIFGIPVISLNEFNGKHVKILIATPENHHDVISLSARLPSGKCKGFHGSVHDQISQG